jgi:hypothetical protein
MKRRSPGSAGSPGAKVSASRSSAAFAVSIVLVTSRSLRSGGSRLGGWRASGFRLAGATAAGAKKTANHWKIRRYLR